MSATKVVYKSDNDQEFFVFTNPGEVSKWRKDKSIPLVDVVQCKQKDKDDFLLLVYSCLNVAFDVFTTPTGSQTGTAERPSKGILE